MTNENDENEENEEVLPFPDLPPENDDVLEASYIRPSDENDPTNDPKVMRVSTSGDLEFYQLERDHIAEIISTWASDSAEGRAENAWLLLASEVGRLSKALESIQKPAATSPTTLPPAHSSAITKTPNLDYIIQAMKAQKTKIDGLSAQVTELSQAVAEQRQFQTDIFGDFMARLDAVEARLLQIEEQDRLAERNREVLSEEISTVADIVHEMHVRLDGFEEYLG